MNLNCCPKKRLSSDVLGYLGNEELSENQNLVNCILYILNKFFFLALTNNEKKFIFHTRSYEYAEIGNSFWKAIDHFRNKRTFEISLSPLLSQIKLKLVNSTDTRSSIFRIEGNECKIDFVQPKELLLFIRNFSNIMLLSSYATGDNFNILTHCIEILHKMSEENLKQSMKNLRNFTAFEGSMLDKFGSDSQYNLYLNLELVHGVSILRKITLSCRESC